MYGSIDPEAGQLTLNGNLTLGQKAHFGSSGNYFFVVFLVLKVFSKYFFAHISVLNASSAQNSSTTVKWRCWASFSFFNFQNYRYLLLPVCLAFVNAKLFYLKLRRWSLCRESKEFVIRRWRCVLCGFNLNHLVLWTLWAQPGRVCSTGKERTRNNTRTGSWCEKTDKESKQLLLVQKLRHKLF